MKKRFSIAVLLTIILGLLPNLSTFSQTYSVSPSGWTGKPSKDVTSNGSTWIAATTQGTYIIAKASVSGSSVTLNVQKNDNSTFQNKVAISVQKDMTISGSNVTSSGTTVASKSLSSGNSGTAVYFDLDFTSGSHTYTVLLASGSIIFYTSPITIKAQSISKPSNPSSPDPSNGATGVSTSGTLSWSCGGTNFNYDLYLATDADFKNRVGGTNAYNSGKGNSCSYSNLKEGQTYYWKVCVWDSDGNAYWIGGDKSKYWSFTTTKSSSSKPSNPSSPNPSNGATGVSTSGTLRWSCGGTNFNYDLYLATDANFKNRVGGTDAYRSGKGNSCSYSNLQEGQTYYWKVCVWDSDGNTYWIDGDKSNYWKFTTASSGQSTLGSIDYNTISVKDLTSSSFTVSWGEVNGATSYDVQVSSSSNYSGSLRGMGVPGRTNCSFAGLQANTTYYLRIRAKNDTKTSEWTKSYLFKTTAAKSNDELTEPAELYLYDCHGFNNKSFFVNQSNHFKTCIENKENATWIGHVYLKNGEENIKAWYDVTISKHGATYLEFDYVPETDGSKQLSLYYQTGKHGKGRLVNNGKFSNPLNIYVNKDKKTNYNLKLSEAITCPTKLNSGENSTIVAKVHNYGSDDWSGHLYIIANSLALITANTTVKAGDTYTITSPVWKPSDGTHSVSVYYKTDDESMKLVDSNGFTNPIDVQVGVSSVPTTAQKAIITYLTKGLTPTTVNEGAVAGYFYRVTDSDGKPLSDVQAIFNCSSPTYKGDIESTWSESNGVVSISLETDGDDAIVKRGQTATIYCTGLRHKTNGNIEIISSQSDMDKIELNVYKGPLGTALERIESVNFIMDLGFSANTDRNKVFDFGASVSFPISYGMKWNPDGTTKNITAGAEAKVEVEAEAGWTKKPENSWIKSVEFGGSLKIGAGIKYNITTPNKKDAAFEMIMKLCEAYEWGTDKVRDFAIKSISSWYYKDRVRDVNEEGSIYVQGSLSGKAEVSFLKKPEAAAGAIKQSVKLPTNKFKSFSIGGGGTFKWEPYIVSRNSISGKTLWGASASSKLTVKGSATNTDINIGDMFGNKSWWKNSKIGKFYENKLKNFATYETLKSEYNRCWSFKEKEMYEDVNKTRLYEISHTTSYSEGLDFSTKNFKLFEKWTPIGASLGGSKTYSMKLVSKGKWARFLQEQYNDGSDDSVFKRYWVGRLFPAFKGKTLLSSADEIYGVLESDIDSPLKNLSRYVGNKSDYPLSEALKMEVSNSSSYNIGVNIPICDWKLVKLNFDLGLTIETECYPSESYYSVADKCFFPVVLQPASSISDVVEYCTNKIADNIKSAFSKEEEDGIEKEAGEILKCEEVEPKTGVPFKLELDRNHRLNSFNRWANTSRARRHPKLAQTIQNDICTLDFTINDGVQNFEEGSKVKYTHYYPAGDLFAVTDKNDTLFVVSDVANLTATFGSDTLTVAQNGKFKLDTHIGVDDLTPFGLAEDLSLDIYRSDENSNVWHYIGNAGSTLEVNELGSYVLATPLASDVASPDITFDLDDDTRKLYISISDNIGARSSSLHLAINGEKREVTPLSTSFFEIQLSEEDYEYRLDVYASVYDIAGNKGELSQMFNLDKPAKVSIEDLPDTDITELENTIYTESLSATAGNDVTLSVKMKNSVEAESFQFDLELPKGVTVVTDEDGFAEADLSLERTTKRKTDTFSTSFLENGTLRVIAGSTGGHTFSGNDGEVATINLHIDNNVAAGYYPIVLRNISISDTEAVSHDVAYVKSSIYVGEELIGDVNGDNVVNAQDVVALVNYMMGKMQLDFNAADVNGDGVVNIADAIMVSNAILKQ